MRFRIRPHSSREGVNVVEVYDDENRFLATIVQDDSNRQLRVISKHIINAFVDAGMPVAVNVALRESRDQPKPLEWVDVAQQVAIINMQRVMMLNREWRRAILVKKTSFEILGEDVTVEEAAGTNGLEIIAVMDNLEVPAHMTSEATPGEKNSTRAAEAVYDEVTIKCPSCRVESSELAWKGNAGACPNCNTPLETPPP